MRRRSLALVFFATHASAPAYAETSAAENSAGAPSDVSARATGEAGRPAPVHAEASTSSAAPSEAEGEDGTVTSDDDPPMRDKPEGAPSEPTGVAEPLEPLSAEPLSAEPLSAEPLNTEPLSAEPPSDPSAKGEDQSSANSPELKAYGAPGKGVTFEFGDQFSLNLKARIQVRYQLDAAAEDASDSRELLHTVNIGTARLWFGGHAYTRDLTYMLQLAVAARDYRDGATSPVYDAFIDYRAHRDLSVRVGQYFVPFDRLRTVRESSLQMADRPLPIQQLTLDRDVGITAYSDTFLHDHSPLAVRVGVFGGGGTNLSSGKELGVLAVGRVELRPLGKLDDDSEGDLERRKKPAIALGAGVARNWNTNRVRSTTGPSYVEGSVDFLHAAADLVFKWRGLALQGELLLRDADADRLDVPPAAEVAFSQSGRGWVAQASYTFDPPFEVVGRLSRIYAFRGTDPAFASLAETSGREVAAGLNYYLNGHKAKIQTDWIGRFPTDYNLSESQHTAHVQLDVTF